MCHPLWQGCRLHWCVVLLTVHVTYMMFFVCVYAVCELLIIWFQLKLKMSFSVFVYPAHISGVTPNYLSPRSKLLEIVVALLFHRPDLFLSLRQQYQSTEGITYVLNIHSVYDSVMCLISFCPVRLHICPVLSTRNNPRISSYSGNKWQ